MVSQGGWNTVELNSDNERTTSNTVKFQMLTFLTIEEGHPLNKEHFRDQFIVLYSRRTTSL